MDTVGPRFGQKGILQRNNHMKCPASLCNGIQRQQGKKCALAKEFKLFGTEYLFYVMHLFRWGG